MQRSFWDKVFEDYAATYWTGLIWVGSALLALIVGLANYRRERSYLLFICYAVAGVIGADPITVVTVRSLQLKGVSYNLYLESFNTIFAIIETTAFFYFFWTIFYEKRYLRRSISLFYFAFLCASLAFLLQLITQAESNPERIETEGYFLNCIQFLSLIILCLLYFYHTLSKEISTGSDATSSPALWVTSGLFLYCIVSLPALIIGHKLLENNYSLHYAMGAIHYLSISLLFICLTKSFSCKMPLTI